jgi:hypothetical protein
VYPIDKSGTDQFIHGATERVAVDLKALGQGLFRRQHVAGHVCVTNLDFQYFTELPVNWNASGTAIDFCIHWGTLSACIDNFESANQILYFIKIRLVFCCHYI